MSYFSELGTATNKAMGLLISSKNLCKLVYYNTADALYKPDVPNPASLIRTKIFPLPKIPEIETAACSYINVFFDDIEQNGINEGFRNEVIRFQIIVHIDLFLLDNGIRPYAIMESIDQLFNNQYYPEFAGHRLQPTDRVRLQRWNDKFYGYVLSYKMVNDSNIAGR